MLKASFIIAFCLLVSPLTGCASKTTPPVEVFDAYFAAVELADGEAAVSYVSSSTIDYYQYLIDQSLDATEAQTRALPLVDKLTVVMVRHRIPAQQVRSMSGRDLFIHGVAKGWVGKESLARFKSDDLTMKIEIESDRAWAYMTDAKGNKSSRMLAFDMESDWKLDLVYTLEVAAPEMKKRIAQSGMNEDVFVGMVAGMKTDRVVTEDVWQPIGRSD